MAKLNEVQCFLLDMDGTIFLGDELIPGAKRFLDHLKEEGKRYIFLTNNSSKNRYMYQEKLHRMGLTVSQEEIFTSGEATTVYLQKQNPGAKVFLLGNEHLEREFFEAGFRLVKHREEAVDYVVLGFDTTLTYDKIWAACDHLVAGAAYIATHPDINCPLPERRFMPDTGAMIKMFEASTGRLPQIIGKPNKGVVDAVMAKYGLQREALAIVGDRLYTDIQLGENAGILKILVLSGETTQGMHQESTIKADHVFPSVKELHETLSILGEGGSSAHALR